MAPLSSFRWKRAAVWAGASLVVLALLAYFAASMLLNNYLRGEAFRALLNAKTSALFAAEGAYAPIQRQGISFYSDAYTARGHTGTALKNLDAEQIRAEFEPAAVFHGAWRIGSLQIQRLKADLVFPGASPAPAASSLETPGALPSPSLGVPTLAAPEPPSRWIPNRFELQKARVEEAALTWPGGSLRQMRLAVEPSGTDWTATGLGGVVEQAGWPALHVDHVRLRYRAPELFLTDSLFELGESERVAVSGQAGLMGDRVLDLQIQWNGIGISRYLPEDWRAGVKGLANGEARLKGNAGGPLRAEGTVRLTEGQLEALPILEKIATFTRTREFRQFALQKAEADFTWTPQKLTVTRFVAESEGLIRTEGPFTVESGNLEGTLQLGVAPSCLRWLPWLRAKVFNQEHDGYVWTAVRVSGPVAHLSEDLTPRLTAATGAEVIDTVKGTLENGAKGIENGARSLFDLIKPLAP